MKIKIISLFVTLTVGVSLLFSQSNPRAFYIGHSLTDYIPEMVGSLSDSSANNTFQDWSFQSIPGAPLRWQWQRMAANDFTPNPPHSYPFYHSSNGLPSGAFDMLILTDAVPRDAVSPWGIQETYLYADSFYNYASQYNPNIQVFIYEVWHCILSGTPTGCDYDVNSNPWRQRLSDDLPMWESVVDTLNQRFNPINPVCLIPGGQGLARLYDSMQAGALPGITQVEDLFEDNIHLNDTGRYFIACIHYATIHKSSPVGLPNQVFSMWGSPFGAPSPQLALKMQEIAWLTVQDYPNNCLNTFTTLQNEIEKPSFGIYPNPANDRIYLNTRWNSSIYTLHDLNGKIIMQGRYSAEGINVEDLKIGTYYIKMNGMVEKFIKN